MVVARLLRPELAAVRVLAVAGLRLVVRLLVVVGCCAPGVLVVMVSSLHSIRSDEAIGSHLMPWRSIEHVFVHDSVAAVTAVEMKSS